MDQQKKAAQAGVETTCPSWWDEYPRKDRHFMQSSLWGRYLEGWREFSPFYCYLEADGEIKGSLLAYQAEVISPPGRMLGLKKLYWHHGPLLADEGDIEAASALLAALFAAAKGPVVLSGFPPYIHQRRVGELYPELAKRFSLQPGEWATYLVDLSGGEEQVWSNLVPDARRLVKKMGNSEFEVRMLDEGSLESYLQLLKTYRRSAGLALPPFYPSVELLRLIGGESLLCTAAFSGGAIRAAAPALLYGETCSFFAAAQEPDLAGPERSVSYLLHWSNLKTACERNLKYYDFSGVAHVPDSAKEEGIKYFKSKWGGEYVVYPTLNGGLGLMGRLLFRLNKLLGK